MMRAPQRKASLSSYLLCIRRAGSRSDSDEEVGGASEDTEASSSSSEDDDDYSERDRCVSTLAGLCSVLHEDAAP